MGEVWDMVGDLGGGVGGDEMLIWCMAQVGVVFFWGMRFFAFLSRRSCMKSDASFPLPSTLTQTRILLCFKTLLLFLSLIMTLSLRPQRTQLWQATLVATLVARQGTP
jgi:hypothetical protein